MKKIITLYVEGNEEELNEMKSQVVKASAPFITAFNETTVEEEKKEIQLM